MVECRRVKSEYKCCHQCQRGRLLAISVNRKKISVYLSLMASTVVGAQLSGGEESVTVGSYSNFPKE
jgi:hypothetical protein